MIHRTTAASASRRNAAPAGPSSSNSVTANAAPTCSDAAAASTMPTAAGRPRTRSRITRRTVRSSEPGCAVAMRRMVSQ
jgi:hypothetical protein